MHLFVHLPSLFYMISKHSNSCLVSGGGGGGGGILVITVTLPISTKKEGFLVKFLLLQYRLFSKA